MGTDRKAVLGVALVLVASVAHGATYYVPDNYGTIQAALNTVATGNTVIVRNGTYNEHDLDFKGKSINLESQNGAAACIIDCQTLGRGFYFHTSEGSGAIVDGFTIRNGRATDGAGVYCSSASPTIRDNVIELNIATGSGGGGYFLVGAPTFTGNTVSQNSAANGGGLWWTTAATLSGNTISRNTASTNGGGIYVGNMEPSIQSNTIVGNTATTHGGGMYLSLTMNTGIEATNNHIVANSCGSFGGGIHALRGVVIRGNVITQNSANHGGGVYLGRYGPTVSQNTLCANDAAGTGSGIWADTRATMTNCTVCGNRYTGVRLDASWGTPTVRNFTVAHNKDAYGFGRGVSGQTLSNSIVWGNLDDLYQSSASYSCIQNGDAGTGNTNQNPRFAAGPSGNWSAGASYDPVAFQSTLTDTGASWTPNALAGMLVNPDAYYQYLEFYVVSNTATTMVVWGDVSSFVGAGDHYEIWDYHVKSFYGRWTSSGWVTDAQADHSPCIDTGNPSDDYSNEPLPHGYAINMGAYGNTDRASMGVGPTAVVLSDVGATAVPHGVLVQWRTGCEPGLAGFRVLRRDEGGVFRPMGEALVACRGNAVTGARYRFLDFLRVPVRSRVSYKVEAIDLSGRATESSGPIAPP